MLNATISEILKHCELVFSKDRNRILHFTSAPSHDATVLPAIIFLHPLLMLQFRSSSHRRDDEAGVFYISIQVSFIKIQSSQDY